MLDELPGSVRTPAREFTLYAGDLVRASELGGLERPAAASGASDWLSYLNGRAKDGAPLPVFVPFSLPLEGSAPPSLVQQELGWSVVDVERFVSWTSAQPPSASSRGLTTTVAEGDFDGDTLADLPEADGIRSAGDGQDLSAELESSTPARPAGNPLRMAIDDGRIVASPLTDVVRSWIDGPARSLADDATLAPMAGILDRSEVYAAMIATPASGSHLEIPEPVFDALGYAPDDFPRFDVYAIGWSVVDGYPEVTVVYHVPRGAHAETVRDHVAKLWAGRSLFGHEVSSLLQAREIQVVDGNVVVHATPAPGRGPDQAFLMTQAEDVPFLTR